MNSEGRAFVSTAGKVVFGLSQSYLCFSPTCRSFSLVTYVHSSLELLGSLLLPPKCPKLQNDFLYFLHSLSELSNSSQLGTDKKQASHASANGYTSDFLPETSLLREVLVLKKKKMV